MADAEHVTIDFDNAQEPCSRLRKCGITRQTAHTLLSISVCIPRSGLSRP